MQYVTREVRIIDEPPPVWGPPVQKLGGHGNFFYIPPRRRQGKWGRDQACWGALRDCISLPTITTSTAPAAAAT